MKKWFVFIALTALAALSFAPAVYADTGPKPKITLRCVNMPEGEVYVCLMVDYSAKDYDYPKLSENRYADDMKSLNGEMLTFLENYEADGWRPMLVTEMGGAIGESIRCEVENGGAVMDFQPYRSVPDRFRLIAITESRDVVVSNIVERKAFQSAVDFDYLAGTAKERMPFVSYVQQLSVTLTLTLIIEGFVFYLFDFSFEKNRKPFLVINTVTQIALTSFIAFATFKEGALSALFLYIFLAEPVIIIAEAVLFAKFLKEQSRARRIGYAITANIVSFLAGVIILF